MSRVQRKRLKVDAASGVDSWSWYMRDAAADVTGWLASIDAGQENPFDVTAVPEAEIPQVEGDFDFAVVQGDAAGNLSDPASFVGWQSVSLDISPPAPATGGVIESVAG
jgi:hypothetical protein